MDKKLRVLITSGGTKTMIDSVRHIGNMSNGTFGKNIANEFLTHDNCEVTFLYAKNSKAPHIFNVNAFDILEGSFKKCEEFRQNLLNKPYKYVCIPYDNFDKYAELLRLLLKSRWDIIILAAAVSDFTPESPANGKIDSNVNNLTINLVKTPKLISEVRGYCPDAYIVGFKLLVGSTDEELLTAMNKQLKTNDINMVVGNDLRDIKNDEHRLLIINNTKPGYIYDSNDYIISKSGQNLAQYLTQIILANHNKVTK